MRVKHWRGIPTESGWNSATVLVFTCFLLVLSLAETAAQAEAIPPPRIALIVDVMHVDQHVLRDEMRAAPQGPYLRPLQLATGQPAMLRCESKIVAASTVRTSCQFLSGSVPGFSKFRWAESRVGKEDSMSFSDTQGNLIRVTVRPTAIDVDHSGPI